MGSYGSVGGIRSGSSTARRGGVVGIGQPPPRQRTGASTQAGPGTGNRGNYQSILDALSKAGGGPSHGAPPPPGITNNTTNANPDVKYASDRLRELDEQYKQGDQRSVARLGRNLADFGQGQKKRLGVGRTARGVSGTGVDDLQNAGVEADLGRQFASGAADIELGVRDRQQGVLRDIAGTGATAAGIAQGDKGLALQQNEANMRRWESIRAAQERERDRQIQLALKALDYLPAA